MIVAITKINGGLHILGKDRFFTNEIYPLGYEIIGDDIANVELDNDITPIFIKDSQIDGQSFTNIQDEINYIFNV
jgi:hypothetical protein